jgi:transposase-like protein
MPQRRRSPERERFWREAVAGHKESGLSVRAFCVERGLSEPSFYAWRRELAQRGRAPRTPAATFVPVQVVADAVVEVVLPSGVVVRVPPATDATAVARLVAALGSPPC